jgi:hypothetical protein
VTAYYVSYADCTSVEPSPGWYYSREDEDGNESIVGPFASKHEALDEMSDGAYSSWLESKGDEDYGVDNLYDLSLT